MHIVHIGSIPRAYSSGDKGEHASGGPLWHLLYKATSPILAITVILPNTEKATERIGENEETEICSKWRHKTKPEKRTKKSVYKQSTREQDNDHKYAYQTFEEDIEILKICLRSKIEMNRVRISTNMQKYK